MSTHEVVHLIRDLHRRERFSDFDADRQGFMRAYDLTGSERKALTENDVTALYEMGVHPMAVLFFGQDNHIPMPDYLAAIGADQARVDQLRSLFGTGDAAAAGIVPSDRGKAGPVTEDAGSGSSTT